MTEDGFHFFCGLFAQLARYPLSRRNHCHYSSTFVQRHTKLHTSRMALAAKIEPEFDGYAAAGIVRRKRRNRTGTLDGPQRRVVHLTVAARLRLLNVGDRAIAQDLKRKHRPGRPAD